MWCTYVCRSNSSLGHLYVRSHIPTPTTSMHTTDSASEGTKVQAVWLYSRRPIGTVRRIGVWIFSNWITPNNEREINIIADIMTFVHPRALLYSVTITANLNG